MGVCVADYDNDGFDDVYVTALMGPNVLYRNNGNGTFTDVTRQAGVGDARLEHRLRVRRLRPRRLRRPVRRATTWQFDERTIPKRGADAGCRFMTVDVSCGPQGLAGEPDVLYHNNGDGALHRRHARGGHQGPGLLRLRRAVHRSRR